METSFSPQVTRMKSSLFSILLVLAFLIAASLPAALGAIFVTRSPLAAGQYSITDDIWVSSVRLAVHSLRFPHANFGC
jgi:hypothetical protein